MGKTGFLVAMAANIGFAACALPSRILHEAREYLIVARWGDEGEFISISRADILRNTAGAGSIVLEPTETWLALLLSEDPGGAESRFLLLRALPEGTKVAGKFLPAEGYVLLQGDVAALSLKAEGRHADCVDRHLSIESDRADPAGPSEAIAWHVEAVQCPWPGDEVVTPPNAARRSRKARRKG